MSVRTRLLVTLGAVALLLVLPAVYAGVRLGAVRDIAYELQGRHAAALVAVGAVQTRLAELNRAAPAYIAAPDSASRARVHEILDRARGSLDRLADAGYEEIGREVGRELDGLAEAVARTERRVEAGRRDEAIAEFEGMRAAVDRIAEPLDRVAAAIDARSRADVEAARRMSQRATATTAVALIAAVLLAITLGWWTTQSVTAPLRQLARAITGVPEREAREPPALPYGRPDEVGDLARAFRSMTTRLDELERMRAEFLSMASHDLKTPISVIHSYAEVLAQGIYGPVDERQREVLDTIADQTRLLTESIEQLVDLGRMDAGGFRIEPARVETDAFFERVRRAFTGLAELQEIDFELVVERSAPPLLRVDAERLRLEVIGNLLSNAFKFTPEGGRIRVTVRGHDEMVEISVADTGPGIDPDQLPHIFDAYFRAGDGRGKPGAGLGLAIARQVIEAHDGAIDAESEPGRGTRFRVLLPRDGGAGDGD